MPEQWKEFNEIWLVRQEQIAPEAWMLCFTRNPLDKEARDNFPTGWVNVSKSKWKNGDLFEKLEEFRLENTGLLELECIAHEMRDKYGSNTS